MCAQLAVALTAVRAAFASADRCSTCRAGCFVDRVGPVLTLDSGDGRRASAACTEEPMMRKAICYFGGALLATSFTTACSGAGNGSADTAQVDLQSRANGHGADA